MTKRINNDQSPSFSITGAVVKTTPDGETTQLDGASLGGDQFVGNFVDQSSIEIDVTSDTLITASGRARTPSSVIIEVVSGALDISTAGAGGLDTGTVAVDTFYFIYLIIKSTGLTPDVILSASAVAPTLPGAYAGGSSVRIGAVLTDSAAALIRTFQRGNQVLFNADDSAENIVFSKQSGAGAGEIPRAGVFTAESPQDFSAFVPPTASRAIIMVDSAETGGGGENIVTYRAGTITAGGGGIGICKYDSNTNTAKIFTASTSIIQLGFTRDASFRVEVISGSAEIVTCWAQGWIDSL